MYYRMKHTTTGSGNSCPMQFESGKNKVSYLPVHSAKPTVVLTSFHRARKMEGAKFSICRFQPAGFDYPELRFLAAEDANGHRIRLQDAGDLDRFVELYRQGIANRWREVKAWLDSLKPDAKPTLLLCWCPFSEQTRASVKASDSFLCHSGLVGKLINMHRPDVRLLLDEDRAERLDCRWRPDRYEVANELGHVELQQNLF